MKSLEKQSAINYDVPRFDDEMVNIQKLIRNMAKALMNETWMPKQKIYTLAASQRNEYRERTGTVKILAHFPATT